MIIKTKGKRFEVGVLDIVLLFLAGFFVIVMALSILNHIFGWL